MSSVDLGEDPRSVAPGPGPGREPGPVPGPAPVGGLESLRRRNTAQVARTLLHHGAIARADISRMTGLSATSVTKITAYLIRMRLLCELAAVSGGDTGRPRVPIALDTSYYRFIGLHIGLRRTTGGLLDASGRSVMR